MGSAEQRGGEQSRGEGRHFGGMTCVKERDGSDERISPFSQSVEVWRGVAY